MKLKKIEHEVVRQCSLERWRWAEDLARVAMGKTRRWGQSTAEDAANEDPLAWWCLTEAIAVGGPK